MDLSRLLVLGANGQLGRAFQAAVPQARVFDRQRCDLSISADIEALPWGSFDVLINAAAYTAVDKAETDEGFAQALIVNAEAPGLLATLCAQHSVTLVHFSTDYVFDGTLTRPYLETDHPNPLGKYGKTKALGDEAVAQWRQHYILRTGWVVGEGNNFVRTMLSLAERGIDPAVVDDQIGRLTFTGDLVAATLHLLKTDAPFGTYNCTGEGKPASWCEVAQLTFELAGADPQRVTGVSTSEYFEGKTGIAPRPASSVLDLGKLENAGFHPTVWSEQLAEYVRREHRGDG